MLHKENLQSSIGILPIMYRKWEGNRSSRLLERRILPMILILSAPVTVALFLSLVGFMRLPESVSLMTLALIGLNLAIWSLPFWIQRRREQIDIFHPLFYAAISFAIPMIIVKGIFIAFNGYSYWLTLIDNAPYYINLALTYFAVGWLAVLIGFYTSLGVRISRKIRLPEVIIGERKMVLFPVFIVFIIGVGFNLVLFREGAFGSALSEFTGNLLLVSIMRPLSGWMGWSVFLLVFCSVRYKGKGMWQSFAMAAGLIYLGFAFLAGSRGAIFSSIIMIAVAIFYARYPIVKWRKILPLIAFAGVALVFGVLVFSQYRYLRQGMYGLEPTSLEETISVTKKAFQQSAEQPIGQQISFVGERFIERFTALDMLSVTLARSESLKTKEQEVGIDNNIMKEMISSLIPRPLWRNKPMVGEFGLWFTRIYLDIPRSNSSNGPTVFGDLYRNYGFVGVLLGMFLVGIYLRIIYEKFIRHGICNPLTPLFYISLYSLMNWEATYSLFITNGIRVLFSLLAMTAFMYYLGGIRSEHGKVRKYFQNQLYKG